MNNFIELKEWYFEIESLGYKKKIQVPHTWNVDDNVASYRGQAIYKTNFKLAKKDESKDIFIKFNAVYHTAIVYVNNILIGKHQKSGYTPFTFDITQFVKFNCDNEIKVIVRNDPNEDMLPHKGDFDWADDGGIIRPVRLYMYSKDAIHWAHINYKITKFDSDICSGFLWFKTNKTNLYEVHIVDETKNEIILERTVENDNKIEFEELKLWSVDNPYLYKVIFKTENGLFETYFGLREIKVTKDKILLNRKEIFLKGCEWMPGSNPTFGIAESKEEIDFRLTQLKELGCNFTRFHWQQDEYVFEWCDRNGLLVQEEIPYWGYPKVPTKKQINIAIQQADEMLLYHYNHPSIIFWGVGNELGGEQTKTINYVKYMINYFKSKDKGRLVNYVSNTISRVENADLDDACLYGDIVMWNDYLGLWEPSNDIEGHIRRTCAKVTKKPIVISEFGLCEPQFKGGDTKRCQILSERLLIYKSVKNIKGYVWFSLNDYRTHLGEAGEGKLRQRVHGSTDLYGNKKPSYHLFLNLQKDFKQ